MDHDNKEFNEIIIKEFKKLQLRQLFILMSMLFIYPIVILLIAILDNRLDEMPRIVNIGIGLVMVAPILLGFYNWRCPFCSTFFGKRSFWITRCHMCGVKLK